MLCRQGAARPVLAMFNSKRLFCRLILIHHDVRKHKFTADKFRKAPADRLACFILVNSRCVIV